MQQPCHEPHSRHVVTSCRWAFRARPPTQRQRPAFSVWSHNGRRQVAATAVGSPYDSLEPHIRSSGVWSRRALLALTLAASPLAALPQPAMAQELSVGPGQQYTTVTAAVAAAAPGDTVRVLPGRYLERLVLDRPVTILGNADNPAAVELVWETEDPYQATVLCAADGVVIRGVTIRHRSPSIANNYAVQMQDCSAALDACDISSSTGSGVGSEGGSPQIYRCTIHDCTRHGVAVFGGLDGSRASAVIEGCSISWNKGHGVLVRDGATPTVTDSTIARNGGYGLMLQDCGGSYSRNTVVENAQGAAATALMFEDFDVNDLVVENKMDRYPAKLSPLRK